MEMLGLILFSAVSLSI